MSDLPTTTAAQRLAHSRKALVGYMNGEPSPRAAEDRQPGKHPDGQRDDDGTVWGTVSRTLRVWWQHHPLHTAVELAGPSLGSYAREHPMKLLGVAAVAGAAAVVLKPWRLVSIGGLLLATLKSSELSAVVMSLMSRHPAPVHPSTREEFP